MIPIPEDLREAIKSLVKAHKEMENEDPHYVDQCDEQCRTFIKYAKIM